MSLSAFQDKLNCSGVMSAVCGLAAAFDPATTHSPCVLGLWWAHPCRHRTASSRPDHATGFLAQTPLPRGQQGRGGRVCPSWPLLAPAMVVLARKTAQ